MTKYIITDSDDMFVFGEVIKNIEARKVLDIGMFLKRIGSISRTFIRDYDTEQMQIDGIDFDKDIHWGIFETIYDNIYELKRLDELSSNISEQYYDLAVMIKTTNYLSELLSEKKMIELCDWLVDSSRFILVDEETLSFLSEMDNKQSECFHKELANILAEKKWIELKADINKYYILHK